MAGVDGSGEFRTLERSAHLAADTGLHAGLAPAIHEQMTLSGATQTFEHDRP